MADLQSYRERFQDRLSELIQAHKVPGAALGIALGDETLELAAGIVNADTGVEATADTLFQIGSITKVYTATMLMQLVDEGKVGLDEPVVTYVPELVLGDDDAARTITVRQLLDHTSGMDGDLFEDFGRGDDCIERYVASFGSLAQMAPPGSFFSYCNSGFVLAGRMIEKIDGVGFDEALKKRVLEPIGASRSTMLPEEAILHRVSVGHMTPPDSGDPVVIPQWILPRALGPAGLIAAPVGELLAFARLHLEDGVAPDGTQVLSAAGVRAMQEEQVVLPDPYTLGRAWGLGWILYDWGAEPVIGHDGNTLGQSGFLRLVPERSLAVALLANGSGASAVYERIYDEVFRELVGMAVPKKPEAAADQGAFDVAPFAGVYERLGARLTFEVVDGRLQLRSENTGPLGNLRPEAPPIPLDAVDDTTFVGFVPEAGVSMPVVFFDFDDTGRPNWVHMGARATRRVS